MAVSKSWLKGHRVSRRRFLETTAAGTAAAAFLAACGGDNQGGGLQASENALKPGGLWYARDNWKLEEEKNGVPGGRLPIAQSFDIRNSLDIYLDFDAGNSSSAGRTYEYLVARNVGPGIQPGSPAAREFRPVLAESWEVADGGLTFTWKLRQGVKFQNRSPANGRVMDIEDWRQSDERFMSTSFYASTYKMIRDRVEFPDSTTMVYRMREPFAEVLDRATSFTHYAILPRELNSNPDLAKTTAVGTGARILDKRTPSVSIEYVQNPDYWGGKPFIDRWFYPIIPEPANQYAQFVAKNVYSYTPTPGDVLNVRRDNPDAVMLGLEPSQVIFYRMRWGKENLAEWAKDARARIAIRKAVDWDKIRDFLGNKDRFAAEGIDLETYTGTHIYNDPNYWLDPKKGELGEYSSNYLFDLAEAKKLMAAAGHPDGVESEVHYGADLFGTALDRVNITNDELNRSGVIRMKPVAVPAAEVVNRVYVQNAFEGMMANIINGGGLDFYLKNSYSTGVGGIGAFKDDALNDLVLKQARELDIDRRVDVLKDIQRYLAREFYEVPTDGNYGSFTFNWPWIHNIIYSGPGDRAEKYWLDEKMPGRNG